FKPLANAYSKKLANFTQQSQGLVPIKKGDFFLLFWDSWRESFTKRTILRSFAATGIWPMDRERVLKRFPPKPPNKPNNKPEPTWREADRLLHAAVNRSSSELKKVSTLLHHLANQNELLTDENEGLREALTTKKKHNKKGKAANALYNKKLKEERRVATAAKREEREKEKAEKAAKAAARKAAQNTTAPIQTSQTGKRKASQVSAPKGKRQKRSSGAAAPAEVAPAVPAKVARSGRVVKLPTRY
ncbi:hypothetical protein EJ07DRAFT_60938, partial [Lizonia empirigonia]